jgi:membrane fusion protein (multidrug efflux system)
MIASAALLTTACAPADRHSTTVESGGDASTDPPKIVAAATVSELDIRDEIVLSAEVAPWAGVTLTAELAAQVHRLTVDIGDRVTEGQVLAVLDEAESRALQAQAEAQAVRARAALAQAETDLERGEKLAATSDISVNDLDSLRLGRDTAAAQAAEAEAAVELARERMADTSIRAPWPGVISERMVEIGTWVSIGSPVLRLVDDRRMKARAAASQVDRSRLQPGFAVVVRAHALPGAVFAGRVRALGSEADTASGTYLVEAVVDRPVAPSGARLLAGMQGTMTVEIGVISGLFVPRSAVIERDGKPTVFVIDGGVARARFPQLGRETPDHVQVLGGIEVGRRVVTQGQHLLTDGDRVEVRGE